MRVAIGSDHDGVELKETVKASLIDDHYDVLDVGTDGGEPADYPESADAVAEALREAKAERGILLSGSGVGASIAVNRIPGIRAGLCHDTYSAHQGVEHDDMNVLVLGERVVGAALARDLVRAFLNARFAGEERHRRRLAGMTAVENPVRALQVFGQSVWLDYVRRSLMTSGELRRLIDEDGLRGVTSNPSIFEKAIAGSTDYDKALATMRTATLDPKTLYEKLAIDDIRAAADALKGVYGSTDARDGYVSLEVAPSLAYDTDGTLKEARRLWRAVQRANLMIKIPATPQGIAAIADLIADGINLNVTLLFGIDAYEQTVDAYMTGLENLAARGGGVKRVASVASFFVSRIDSAVDSLIAGRLETSTDAREQSVLRGLAGKVAIANARVAYQRYRDLFSSARWRALADRGAQTQRLLWASTGTKNPQYRDVLYVEELIGPDTVNTIPPTTLDAFRDHGRPRASLTEDTDAAFDTMSTLEEARISMKAVTGGLLSEGVRSFVDAFDKLLHAIEKQTQPTVTRSAHRFTYALPRPIADGVKTSLAEWGAHGKVRRLWARDASLWTGKDEARWLGWLGITADQLVHIDRMKRISEVARESAFTDVLLLGMGGSSLGPEVLRSTFGAIGGFPRLHVLDSTDPAQVGAFERKIDPAHTLFVVSSKSGSTLEPNIFAQYFYDRVVRAVGALEAGKRFLAITDPGSKMQQVAESQRFRHIFFGWPTIGGRYSVLSDFGLVPAAIIGIDVPKLLERTELMVCACMPPVPVDDNPGVVLGTILGVAAARFGRDKVTFVMSPGVASLGGWLEQLIAESTGKEGKGLIPINGETAGAAGTYGDDRIFVGVRLKSDPKTSNDERLEELERAGHPIVRITLEDAYDLGAEFFRWEIATAVAGSILGVHPFDQPDVEASKIATRRLTGDYEQHGTLPAETAMFEAKDVKLFTDERNAAFLTTAVKGRPTLPSYLKAHLGRIRERDYFAMLAYIEMNDEHDRILQQIRQAVRDATGVATCVEFGPRFLHSTGQAYKGGPDSGVFLQITCDDAADLNVPGQKFTFGIVKAAQARGDFQVLAERGRRALRVHIGPNVAAGLTALHSAVSGALKTTSRQ